MSDLLLQLFNGVIRISGAGVLTALVVAFVQMALGRKLPRRWRSILWAMVLIRLLVPTTPQSRFSALNLLGHSAPSVAARQEIAPDRQIVSFGVVPPGVSVKQPLQLSEAAPAKTAVPWSLMAARLWLLIALALLMRTIIGNTLFRRKLLAVTTTEDPRLLALLESCRLATGAPRVRLVETTATNSPALFGVFHPMLLMPPGFARRVSDEELAFVFRHELIHARRRDLLIACLVRAIVSVHWFNPIVWLVARQFRAERELACDESVVAGRSTDERLQYGQTILRRCNEFSVSRSPAIVAGLIDRPGMISRRIHAIASPARRPIVFSAIGVLCVTIIGCTTFTAAKCSTEPSSVAPKQTSTRLSNELVTGVYDVRGVLNFIPDRSGDFVPARNLVDPLQPEADTPRSSLSARQDRVNKLIRKIEAAVDPASWDVNGSASIREASGQLIIDQTPANQDAIATFLHEMFHKLATQITVEARLLEIEGAAFDSWRKMYPGDWIRRGDADVWSKPLPAAETSAILHSVNEANPGSRVNAPRITLFDGQRAYVLATKQQAYVRDLHLEAASSQTQPAAYKGDVDIVETGTLLDLSGEVGADFRHVTLTLKPQFSELLRLETAPWPKAPEGRSDLKITVPHVRVFAMDTTITVPEGQSILFRVSGREYPLPATQIAAETRYLLVKARVLREDEPPERLSLSPTSRK
jgi:beta-lactamase regulating signal transducer with metallopeptidase domain